MTALNLKPLIADASPTAFASEGALILAEALRPTAISANAALASVAAGSIVATISGPVAARDLRAGDLVLTRDNGYAAVVSVQSMSGEAAIEVGAGVLGNSQAMALPVRAGVVISGPSFETLFGAREVIVPAGALVDGVSVRPVGRLERFETVVIDLGDGEVIWAGDIALSCPSHAEAARPVLAGRDAAVAARLAGFGADARATNAA